MWQNLNHSLWACVFKIFGAIKLSIDHLSDLCFPSVLSQYTRSITLFKAWGLISAVKKIAHWWSENIRMCEQTRCSIAGESFSCPEDIKGSHGVLSVLTYHFMKPGISNISSWTVQVPGYYSMLFFFWKVLKWFKTFLLCPLETRSEIHHVSVIGKQKHWLVIQTCELHPNVL